MSNNIPSMANLPPQPEATAALERLLQTILNSTGSPQVRLQCVIPNAETLSTQWNIVSGDPHVVSTTALDCLDESGQSGHTARALLSAGSYHLSIRSTSDGYTVAITMTPEADGTSASGITSELVSTPARQPGISSGVPATVPMSSPAGVRDETPRRDSHIGQYKNEVGRHGGDEVPDDDRMVEAPVQSEAGTAQEDLVLSGP